MTTRNDNVRSELLDQVNGDWVSNQDLAILTGVNVHAVGALLKDKVASGELERRSHTVRKRNYKYSFVLYRRVKA